MRFLMFILPFVFYISSHAEPTSFHAQIDLSRLSVGLQKEIERNIPEIKNEQWSTESLNELTKKIFKLGSLNTLEIEKVGSAIIVYGNEIKQIFTVDKENMVGLSEEEFEEIAAFNLPENISEEKYAAITERLESALHKKGYRQAKVEYKVAYQSLVFSFNSGKLNVIKQLELKGLSKEHLDYARNKIYWMTVGRPYTDDLQKKIQTQIRYALNEKGLYKVLLPAPVLESAKDHSEIKLIYRFTNEKVQEVRITGTKHYSPNYLKNDVLKLGEFTALDESFPEDIKEKLQNFYLENGFTRSRIRLDKKETVLHYKVIEGAQTHIESVNITGNIPDLPEYSSAQLTKKFFSVASGLTAERIHSQVDTEQTIKNFITSLQNEGYVNTQLRKTEIKSERSKNKSNVVEINLLIDMGSPTILKAIHLSNHTHFTREQIIKTLKIEPNKILNLIQLEQGLSDLEEMYQNMGYLEFQITNLNDRNLVTYNNDASEATVNLNFYEGPQITVKDIIIDGNQITKNAVILTELEFKTGDVLTPYKLTESLNRLQKTGLFASAEIVMLESNSAIAERTLIVKLSERKPGLFTASVGMTNELEYTFKGSTGVAYRNISGWGRGLSLRAEASYNPPILNFLEGKVIVGFLEPYLLGTRSRFRVNYTTSQSVSDYSVRKKTLMNQAIWSVEQDITSNLTLIWQIYNITNYVDSGITREDEINYGYSREDMVIASMGPTFDFDYRDNILNPFEGHFSSLNLEYASNNLGSHNIDDFLRLTGQTTLYTPLSKTISWANSVRGGYLQPLKQTKDGIRFDKKGFVLGGRTTVRGFESGEFFPSLKTLGAQFGLEDSSSYQLIKSELRFPLSVKSNLYGALFYDGGQVVLNNLASTIDYKTEWRDSIGFGIRYNLPIGPLNVEYARKLNRKNDESEGAFHLSVGIF